MIENWRQTEPHHEVVVQNIEKVEQINDENSIEILLGQVT